MRLAPTNFDLGSVVLATIRHKRGGGKTRPVLVLVTAAQVAQGHGLLCMAITTTFPDPPPNLCVELPWDSSGRCATGLRQRSAAVIDWVLEIDPLDIVAVIGVVPAKTLERIRTHLSTLKPP